ncbi:S-adenosyl-L-methionine-dependent methyltransferase [Mariannaea sp. PMI_226]|nr:S-adenosyl-L-methionine-dependent methyltransferase [Mariannaea sp. PMI_226]
MTSTSPRSPSKSASPVNATSPDRIDPAIDQTVLLEPDDLADDDSALGVTDEELSTASLRSSILEYHMRDGRGYHRDLTYFLPSDEHESDRLDLQNHHLRLTFGGKRYFSPNADTAKRVLDVGTGTGVWAIEFADEHPHAEVFGVDIAAIQPAFVPPNCTFEVDDVEKDWTWGSKFDYIFVRLMTGSFADWEKFTRQCCDFLEPGGWVEIIDPTLPAKSEDGTLHPDSPLHKWGELTTKGAANLGRRFDEGVNHESRLKALGFVNVQTLTFKWPTNTWPKDPKFKEIGLWTLANIEGNLEVISSILLARGLNMSREEILVFLADVRAAMRDRRVHAYWDVVVVIGQKPEVEEGEEKE